MIEGVDLYDGKMIGRYINDFNFDTRLVNGKICSIDPVYPELPIHKELRASGYEIDFDEGTSSRGVFIREIC